MAISITQLFNEIGSDKINFQWLNSCMTSARQAKAHTTVSFKTDAFTTTGDLRDGKVGIIVWVNESDLNAALATLREQEPTK